MRRGRREVAGSAVSAGDSGAGGSGVAAGSGAGSGAGVGVRFGCGSDGERGGGLDRDNVAGLGDVARLDLITVLGDGGFAVAVRATQIASHAQALGATPAAAATAAPTTHLPVDLAGR